MIPIGMVVWADVAYPGVDVAAMLKRTLERLRGHLAALDRTLDEWRWLETAKERQVMLADCFLWEELSVAQQVFGDALKLEETPTLNRVLAESPVRSVADGLLRKHPCQITGRPAEADMLAKLSGHARPLKGVRHGVRHRVRLGVRLRVRHRNPLVVSRNRTLRRFMASRFCMSVR